MSTILERGTILPRRLFLLVSWGGSCVTLLFIQDTERNRTLQRVSNLSSEECHPLRSSLPAPRRLARAPNASSSRSSLVVYTSLQVRSAGVCVCACVCVFACISLFLSLCVPFSLTHSLTHSNSHSHCKYIGDMLRAAVVAGTDLGKEAKGHMDSGGLVPDKLIIDIIIARLAENDCVENGWLLDGFPRTRGQADALAEAGLTCDTFILLNVPDHLLVERVCGRRSDPDTGIIYHIKYKPAPTEEIAARLTQRSDDTEDAIMVRIQNFHANVLAIIDAYQNQLVSVDGTRAPAVVWAELQTRISRSFQREIVLATGAPGSGRREVCAEVAKQNGYRYLNVGDALRAATSHKSAELIADSMKRHEAVDPVIVMEVVSLKVN